MTLARDKDKLVNHLSGLAIGFCHVSLALSISKYLLMLDGDVRASDIQIIILNVFPSPVGLVPLLSGGKGQFDCNHQTSQILDKRSKHLAPKHVHLTVSADSLTGCHGSQFRGK